MSLFIFLTVVQALVAAALVGVILMQRSEGGGLGVGVFGGHGRSVNAGVAGVGFVLHTAGDAQRR